MSHVNVNFVIVGELFGDRSPSHSVRNNLVSEVISSACSGCIENLISHISNKNVVKALIKSY